MTDRREEVRRDEDGELLGYVQPVADGWQPVTTFGVALARVTTYADSVELLEGRGLEILADRWLYRSNADGEWYTCHIQQAHPEHVQIVVSDFGAPEGAYTQVGIAAPGPDNLKPDRLLN